MIKDRAYWEAWEAGDLLREPLDFERALALLDDVLEYAHRLGVFPSSDLEDLVIHKIIAGRPRDLEDVRGILLKNRTYQVEYICHWLQEFDRSLGATYLAKFEDLSKTLI